MGGGAGILEYIKSNTERERVIERERERHSARQIQRQRDIEKQIDR